MPEPTSIRSIGLRHKMAQADVNEAELERRKGAALELFEQWNGVTGCIHEGSSWYWELKSVIEDAVEIGLLGETLKEPEEG